MSARTGRSTEQGRTGDPAAGTGPLTAPPPEPTAADPRLAGVTAVVLTHRRPELAGDVVRMLVHDERLDPRQVVVVVNAVGGLDDPALESAVRMVRLRNNLGPAGGFEVGMIEAFADPDTRWAYLCEDDICLLPLPRPRLADLLARIEARGDHPRAVGAVVAFGRHFVGRGAHTVNQVPPPGTPHDLARTGMGSWGATVLSRRVFDSGVRPDTSWYFGLEDFDWYCRISEAGFDVLVDAVAARAVADQQSTEGRRRALAGRRTTDGDEAWRAYYHARNNFALARRHGDATWYLWHLGYSARRLQRAGPAERRAIVHGLVDGARGRMGEHPRYGRRGG